MKVITKSKIKIKTKIVKVVKVKIVKVKEKSQIRPWRASPFIVTGIGALVIVAGVIMGGLSKGKMTERDTMYADLVKRSDNVTPPAKDVTQLHNTAETFAMTANTLFISGGVITTVGAILILTVGRASLPKKQKKSSKKQKISLVPLMNHAFEKQKKTILSFQ